MPPKIGTSKEVKKIIKLAKSQGWQVRMTGGKHIQFIPKDKRQSMVVTSLTASDQRAINNLRAWLRSSGLKDL